MSVAGRLIVVTGATGFLGSHISRALIDAGAHVRGAVRSPEKGAPLRELGAEMVYADLTEPATLAEAFAGADAVISNAALATRKGSPWSNFVEANIQGAENVVHAVAKAGVKRLVHISTVAVYKPRLQHCNREEDTQSILHGTRFSWSHLVTDWRYSVSKAMGEDRVWELSRDYGLDTTTLRPGPIYGSGDTKLTATYAQAMGQRLRLAPTFRLPHVHAGDVASALLGALINDASIGQGYNVTGTPVSPYDVLRTWAAITGMGPTLIPIPTPLWIDYADDTAKRDLGFSCRGIEAGIREVLTSV
jgi:nucleoside-diphosphate-sugar epimerase